MNKNRIAVTVMILMIGMVSLLKSDEFSADFDRGLFKSADFMSAIKTFELPRMTFAASETTPFAISNAANTAVYQLSAPGLQKLRKEVLNMPELSKEFFQLINDGKTIVLYNNEIIFLVNTAGDNEYYLLFESKDNRLIKLLARQKPEVPQTELFNKQWVKTCWPIVKTVWKWVQGAWTAYEIVEFICEQEWVDDKPEGAGGTAHTPVDPNAQKLILR